MARRKSEESPEERARIGARIKLAATQAGLKLMQLAEAADIQPRERVYAYVRGITAVPEDVLDRIAQVTRVHTDFFDPEKDARQTLALPADTPTPEEADPLAGYEPGTRSQIQEKLEYLQELAEAQDYPKRDRVGYITTLSRMIELSQLLKNKPHEGWVHWNLGRVRMEDDLDEARQDLMKARALFEESGFDPYRFRATQELAYLLGEQGAFDAAQTYLQETLQSPDPDIRWRAQLSLGSLSYRQHNYEEAMRYFRQAAETLEMLPADQRERTGLPELMTHVADVARATGHHAEAIQVWGQCLEQAFLDRNASAFLEALMEIAQCYLTMGELNEGKQKLELAVTLTGFLFEDSARLSVARALLANACLMVGAVEEAREHARRAVKVAYRVGRPRPMILASLALAEANLANRQWQSALEDAQEALNEAGRTKRTREVGQAHELRARAYLCQMEESLSEGRTSDAEQAIQNAIAAAIQARTIAEESNSPAERVAAHLTLARCYMSQGDTEAAENEARMARELTESGAIGLALLDQEADTLPLMMRSEQMHVPSLFRERRLNLPLLEWQVHYLEGRLLEHRLGPESAYLPMQHAARTLKQLMSSLTQKQVASFRQRYPEVDRVFSDLQRVALTEKTRREAIALIEA